MPFDGSGTYAPPSAPTFPAVSGAVISSSYYNSTINDLAAAFNNVLTRDGQGKPSAHIDWNAKNLTNVAAFAATGNVTIGGTFGVTGATTLAALTASGLATLNAGATITGAVGITGDVSITDVSPIVTIKDSDSLKAVATLRFNLLDSADASVGWFGFNGDGHFNIQNDAGGEVRVGGSRILTIADEGTGNGLDADTVDGQHATIFNYRANNLSDVASAATARSNLGLAIGTDVQAYNANLTTWAGKTVPSGNVVGTSDAQTLTNKTLTGVLLDGGYAEEVYTLTGTTPALEPANGSIQVWALTGNSTPTDSIGTGESLTLMVSDGTAYTVTWPSVTWVEASAPVLPTSGYAVIVLWKVATTLYGLQVGNVA